MNEQKRKYDWCVSYTCFICSHPIYILGVETLLLEEDCKKIISISHLLEGN